MGFLSPVCDPHIYRENCTLDEWWEHLRSAILCFLQDEEECGRPFDLAEFRDDFPQLTLREFVIACGEVAAQAKLIGR